MHESALLGHEFSQPTDLIPFTNVGMPGALCPPVSVFFSTNRYRLACDERIADPFLRTMGGMSFDETDAAVDTPPDRVIEAIITSAKTGKVGDGKIFVFDLAHVIRIRTNERDAQAI